MQQVFISIVMMIISAALQAMLQPKPTPPQAGKLDFPSAQEGDPIPVVFGTVVLKQPNVLWFGHLFTTPIYPQGGKK